jgi:hypothetical protein
MDSGTSFDGQEIDYKLYTAYYYYKMPRYWKRFYRITFEVDSVSEITIYIRPVFDYNESEYASAETDVFDIEGAPGIWGVDDWGTMVWASTEVTNRVFYDMLGIGGNMSIKLNFKNKYASQHSIQNMIVDYQFLGRQM